MIYEYDHDLRTNALMLEEKNNWKITTFYESLYCNYHSNLKHTLPYSFVIISIYLSLNTDKSKNKMDVSRELYCFSTFPVPKEYFKNNKPFLRFVILTYNDCRHACRVQNVLKKFYNLSL